MQRGKDTSGMIPATFKVDTTVRFYYSRFLNQGKAVDSGRLCARHLKQKTSSVWS